MTRVIKCWLIILMFCLVSAHAAVGSEAGKTDTVFNKRFIPKIRPMMPYEQLTGIIGAPGAVVRDARGTSAHYVRYRWYGKKRSTLDTVFVSGKLYSAAVLAPNGNTYRIGK